MKITLLVLILSLSLSISFAQYGVDFVQSNVYIILAGVAFISTYYIVANTFSTSDTRTTFSKPAGLFAATVVVFAFYTYRPMIEEVVMSYTFVLVIAAIVLLLLTKSGGVHNLDISNAILLFGAVILLGIVFSSLGWYVGEYVMLTLITIVFIFLMKWFSHSMK